VEVCFLEQSSRSIEGSFYWGNRYGATFFQFLLGDA
jgi:hypothetical protein